MNSQVKQIVFAGCYATDYKSKGFGNLLVWSIQLFVNTMTQSSHEWMPQQNYPEVRPCKLRETAKNPGAIPQMLQPPVSTLNIKVHDSMI